MILDLHANIGKQFGIYSANRILALLKTMFNKAIEWEYCLSNPCMGIKKFKEKSRERFLQADELPRFFKALNSEPNKSFKDYFYITLLTGARRRTVGSMNWKDINFANNTWKIEETKNGELQIVHLSEPAINILKDRFNIRSSEWVFPSATSASGHIEEPKTSWKKLLKRANIDDLHIHDLRRTLGSWQAATGANSYIIGKSLGHKTPQATAIYARLNLDPVRESVNKATDAMFATINQNNQDC
jgi:integrase